MIIENKQDWFEQYLSSPLCGLTTDAEIRKINREFEAKELMPDYVYAFNPDYQYLEPKQQEEMVNQCLVEFIKSEWNVEIATLKDCLYGFFEEKHFQYLADC